MPLIRLSRDKRGLDTLYLLHQRSDGRGGSRLRVLYFGAAPQGLAFGRPWLDADTQRALERRYPDVAFDWPALERELEQRRLPPPADPQVRRLRPGSKTERRAGTSDVPTDKPGSGKRKRRRGAATTNGQPAPRTAESPSGGRESATNEPPAAPIIDPS